VHILTSLLFLWYSVTDSSSF